MAEVLQQHGYATAVVGPRILFELYRKRFVFYDGFSMRDLELPPGERRLLLKQAGVNGELPFDRSKDIISPHLTEKAVQFIEENQDQRFFLWLHYYDPHSPYLPNPETESWGNKEVDLYDGELRRSDEYFGMFWSELKNLDISDRTVMVIFGDHGEEFMEHGGKRHATTLYQEVIHVPLIIYVPGIKPKVIRTPVSLLDLFPTVLALLGIEDPPGIHGQSLLPLMWGKDDSWEKEFVISEIPFPRKKALIGQEWKLIYDYRYVTFELYNLLDDPGEFRNLFDLEPEKAAEMKKQLAAFY